MLLGLTLSSNSNNNGSPITAHCERSTIGSGVNPEDTSGETTQTPPKK